MQLEFNFERNVQSHPTSLAGFIDLIEGYDEFGKTTLTAEKQYPELGLSFNEYVNEFWTAKQRACHSLHEISYRACFKPQLPRFFIEHLTTPGEAVYDPFMGRGTTVLESALLDRVPCGCDVNPLSIMLLRPRLNPPSLDDIYQRLSQTDLDGKCELPEELLVFYHPQTLQEICALRGYLLERAEDGSLDAVDEWIRMIAINRLTGHSAGFFSVYTLPPNQAVSVQSQAKINAKRNQTPDYRDVKAIIYRKSKSLLKDVDAADLKRLVGNQAKAILVTGHSEQTPQIEDKSVSLVVTSPPFLDVVNYEQDNWLRCWFAGINPGEVLITMERTVEGWMDVMTRVFTELHRVLRPGGHVAFEVGEVKGGKVKLEDHVVPCGWRAGLAPKLILINDQKFTKTANCWGINNNSKGTNSNRIVLFEKP